MHRCMFALNDEAEDQNKLSGFHELVHRRVPGNTSRADIIETSCGRHVDTQVILSVCSVISFRSHFSHLATASSEAMIQPNVVARHSEPIISLHGGACRLSWFSTKTTSKSNTEMLRFNIRRNVEFPFCRWWPRGTEDFCGRDPNQVNTTCSASVAKLDPRDGHPGQPPNAEILHEVKVVEE